jgi:hypothetical protein
MIRIQSSTAIQDKTFNNLKASKGSVNDLYTQSITKIVSDREAPVEVFAAITSLQTTINTLQQQNAALMQRVASLETRATSTETRLNELVVTE